MVLKLQDKKSKQQTIKVTKMILNDQLNGFKERRLTFTTLMYRQTS